MKLLCCTIFNPCIFLGAELKQQQQLRITLRLCNNSKNRHWHHRRLTVSKQHAAVAHLLKTRATYLLGCSAKLPYIGLLGLLALQYRACTAPAAAGRAVYPYARQKELLLLLCTSERLLPQWHIIQTTNTTTPTKMAAWTMSSSCPATHDIQDPVVNPCRSCSPCCGICYGSPAPAVWITLPMVRQEQTSNREA